MTPKEKAKELTLKFMKIDSDSEKFYEFEMKLFYAQRCALIAVDECLNTCVENMIYYWNEVKKEIENL
jgi:hypothetical protein